MNILIIDDNTKTTNALQQLLQAHQDVGQVHKALLPYMVRSLLACERIDIIFIRIRLWDYRQFENTEQRPVIVFLSGGKDKLTSQAGRTAHYALREPYDAVQVSELLQKITREKFIERPHFLFLRYEGRFHKIPFDDICLVEKKEKNYVKFYFKDSAQLMPGTLTAWLQKLPKGKFIRVSDTLVLPAEEMQKIKGDEYAYKGRTIKLTFRFATGARNETDYWPDGL